MQVFDLAQGGHSTPVLFKGQLYLNYTIKWLFSEFLKLVILYILEILRYFDVVFPPVREFVHYKYKIRHVVYVRPELQTHVFMVLETHIIEMFFFLNKR